MAFVSRVLDNTSAKSKWVAKTVANRLQTTEKVRVMDIINEMRRNHAVGGNKERESTSKFQKLYYN